MKIPTNFTIKANLTILLA